MIKQSTYPILNQKLSKVLGTPYANGNLLFSGDLLLSPVGNRMTVYDLVNQSVTTLPVEARKNIRRLAVSHNGRFLVMVDVDGHALFVNLERKVVLARFNFKRKVRDIKFSPDDCVFAVTHGHGAQIWKTPSALREFSPLVLKRTIGGHNADVTCLDWSADSQSLIMGSKDLAAKIYYRVHSRHMASTSLTGHRAAIVSAYFADDKDMCYTIAKDGAVFTWKFEYTAQNEDMDVEKDKKNEEEEESAGTESDSNSDSESDESTSSGGTVDSSEEEAEDTAREGHIKKISNKKKGNKQGRTQKVVAGRSTTRRGNWSLASREFLWDPKTQISSTSFHRKSGCLVVGFDQGVFGLYEMPGCVLLQKLSVSQQSLNTCCVNHTGEWLGLASNKLGQLLVWEWKSESYVLKQQGHIYGLNSMEYSDDGQYIVTGGEDAKVKLWNVGSGFCFMTFSVHLAPVTCVRFMGNGAGRAVLSASLDGTVRAHDLTRYKNFRTLQATSGGTGGVQFTCLAADKSGEIVCAGSLDPFNIYVWAMQTGQLLDVLAGHEGPLASLQFSGTVLASSSWDGTLKLWDVYKSENTETWEHGCDVIACAFRPDGKEVASAAVNGNIYIWDVESGEQVCVIEAHTDLIGGKVGGSLMSNKSQDQSKYFTCLTYTADGSCLLAGGKSRFVCVYNIAARKLIRRWILSGNRSLEGVLDRIHGEKEQDGVYMDAVQHINDSDDDYTPDLTLPGAGKGSGARDGSRTTKPELLSSSLQFSPTGRDWCVATSQGLQLFTVDHALLFMPSELDDNITPQTVSEAIRTGNYPKALQYALTLGEVPLLQEAAMSVPLEAIPLVVRTVPQSLLSDFLRFLADEISSSGFLEYYMTWSLDTMQFFGPHIMQDPTPYQSSLRSLLRALSGIEKEISRAADTNEAMLEFVTSQMALTAKVDEGEVEGDDEYGEGEQGEDGDFDIDAIVSEMDPSDPFDNRADTEEVFFGGEVEEMTGSMDQSLNNWASNWKDSDDESPIKKKPTKAKETSAAIDGGDKKKKKKKKKDSKAKE